MEEFSSRCLEQWECLLIRYQLVGYPHLDLTEIGAIETSISKTPDPLIHVAKVNSTWYKRVVELNAPVFVGLGIWLDCFLCRNETYGSSNDTSLSIYVIKARSVYAIPRASAWQLTRITHQSWHFVPQVPPVIISKINMSETLHFPNMKSQFLSLPSESTPGVHVHVLLRGWRINRGAWSIYFWPTLVTQMFRRKVFFT